ncbi:MAG: DUF485 domain-containing protein [Armatimonadetes bacterium]|nr:DUF485 domain-containing protein [Armatimonadota bacterium]
MQANPDSVDGSPLAGQSLHADHWLAIEADADFQRLVSSKRRFIIPATVFFVVYYFALPVLVGYFPRLMETNVLGKINLAYLFALSQFFVAWIIAFLYVRKSSSFDRMAAEFVKKVGGTEE